MKFKDLLNEDNISLKIGDSVKKYLDYAMHPGVAKIIKGEFK